MTGTPLDLVGCVFSRLTVLAKAGTNLHGAVLWLCLCECGAQVRVQACSLTSGRTRSCGCLRAEVARARAAKARAA